MAFSVGSRHLITPEDLKALSIFHDNWGVIDSYPNLAISEGLPRTAARTLAQSIRKTVSGIFDLSANEIIAVKGVDSEPALHYVIVPKECIPKLPQTESFSGIQDLLEAAKQLEKRHDQKEHPILELNRRCGKSPEKVQISLLKKMERAQTNLSHFPIKHKPLFRKSPIPHIQSSIINGIKFSTAQLTGLLKDSHISKNHSEDFTSVFTMVITVNGVEHVIPCFGVFDGHQTGRFKGGKEQSKYVGKNIESILSKKLNDAFSIPSPKSSLEIDAIIFNSLKIAFVELSAASHASVNREGSGTTATLCFIFDGCLWTACAGDSKAILSRQFPVDQRVVGLSFDRKPTKQYQTESGEKSLIIDSHELDQTIYNRGSGIKFYNYFPRAFSGLAMLKALGHHEINEGINPRPDITKHQFRFEDGRQFLVIASDGLWDVISPSYVANTLQDLGESKSSEELASLLTELAFSLGSNDDISVLIVEMSPLFQSF